MKLTDKQSLILKLIVTKIAEDGFPPSIREIQKMMGFASTNGVRAHLKALQRKKAIKIHYRTSRGIQVLRSC